MCGILFEILGQVDNVNGFKGTFLDTNTASCFVTIVVVDERLA